jgi:3-oxoacyl-ACP reductase-like protein
MGIFSSIMDKIFHHPKAAAPAAAAPAPTPTAAPAAAGAAPASPAPAAAPMAAVDVEAVLTTMAQDKGGGGNWQSSIVDLLKLLDLDSGLGARKELGEELGVHAGENGSAEQNIALHKAVMQKLAENGGVVPDSLRN